MDEKNIPEYVKERLKDDVAKLDHYKAVRGNLFLGIVLGAGICLLSGNKTAKYFGLATAGIGLVASSSYKKQINELERKIEKNRKTLIMGGIIEDDLVP